jgi:electron transfer flavoprotein alpha subunit
MSRALVLADLHAITAAKQLCEEIDVLVCGKESLAREMATVAGVSRVLTTDSELYAQGLAENSAALIESLSGGYNLIMGVANTRMKNILPRVSGLIDWPMLTDVIEIKDKRTFVRPIYAGNALQTLRMRADQFILTVRAANFEPCTGQQPPAPIEKLEAAFDTAQSVLITQTMSQTERPELGNAKIIVSGGRGLGQKENFVLIEKLADRLHAAVGASRAAVDAGWVPNDYQIGQTGKIVAPDLYIAVGISGAIQHLAGMKDSKIIVAINKDPEAPIFKVADYGLVADLFEALPQLEQALNEP